MHISKTVELILVTFLYYSQFVERNENEENKIK